METNPGPEVKQVSTLIISPNIIHVQKLSDDQVTAFMQSETNLTEDLVVRSQIYATINETY